MLPVSIWLQQHLPAIPQARNRLLPSLSYSQPRSRLWWQAPATGSGAEAAEDFPFEDDASAKIQQHMSDLAASRAGHQLVKGTGSKTLAPGNLTAVRDRLSMPAPAEFEEHDPWTLRAIMEKRKLKEREDALWRARKAQKYSHRHLNVSAFTDYRCRDEDEEPARHYSHDEIMNIITGDWKNANPFTVEHQCNNPISRADWAREGIERPPETDEWIRDAGLMSFGDVLAPKIAPSQDMLDAEFQGLEGT
ncbi:hypothetical protein WJX84_002046 [Apatococcus fuscideae]